MGLSRTVSEIKANICKIFPPPKYPTEGVPSKFVMVVGSKTRIMPYQIIEKV